MTPADQSAIEPQLLGTGPFPLQNRKKMNGKVQVNEGHHESHPLKSTPRQKFQIVARKALREAPKTTPRSERSDLDVHKTTSRSEQEAHKTTPRSDPPVLSMSRRSKSLGGYASGRKPSLLEPSLTAALRSERKTWSLGKVEEGGQADMRSTRKLSLREVVGLEAFKKFYKGDSKGKQTALPKISKETRSQSYDVGVLPESPRFAATLSKPAQMATLSCYEDILHESIHRECRSAMLKRKGTPQPGDGKDEAPSQSSPKSDPEEQPRRLSMRMKVAMTLLDHMKDEKGELTTTPRSDLLDVKGKDLVESFNIWGENWRSEFDDGMCDTDIQ